MTRTAVFAVYDTLADWETGHLAVELRTGRFTGEPWRVLTVAESAEPVTTMGGIAIVPDLILDRLDPGDVDLLVLAGAGFWETGERGAAFVELARRLRADNTPVAAICGASWALADAGLLDDHDHTSAAPDYLAQAGGYHGAGRYRDERAVADRGLITAGPQSPVHFAAAALGALGLMDADRRAAYVGVFAEADPAAFATLMQHA